MKRKPLNLPKADHLWVDKDGKVHKAKHLTDEDWKKRLEKESESEKAVPAEK